MQYVCESDVLAIDASHVFKLLIAMTNSKQCPILAAQKYLGVNLLERGNP